MTSPPRRSASAPTGPGVLSVVLGTSGVVLAPLSSYEHDPAGRVHAFCHAVPGAWQAMGVMLSAAGSLQWFHERLAPDVPFDRLVEEAERWEPGAGGLVFLPYLAGERTPHADPDARGAFVGLELRHDRGALVRAVLEGVAFGLRDCLDLLRSLGVDARPRAYRAAAREATCGCGSSRPSSTSRSSGRPRRRAPRSAPRCSAASPGASSPTSTRRWRAACA